MRARPSSIIFLVKKGSKSWPASASLSHAKGIYPPLPDANKIELVEMIDMDKEAYAEKMAEYKKIFLQN